MDSLQESLIHPPRSQCEACFNMGESAYLTTSGLLKLLYSKAWKSQDKDSSEEESHLDFWVN